MYGIYANMDPMGYNMHLLDGKNSAENIRVLSFCRLDQSITDVTN